MTIAPGVTSLLWIASKLLAVVGVLLCFFSEAWDLTLVFGSRTVGLPMRNALPVVFFCLAAVLGVSAWALDVRRLLTLPVR